MTTALVVDDEVVNATVLRAMLEKMGCVVSTVFNAKAALAVPQVYSIAFIDLMMPDTDGADLTAELRRRRFVGPIIIVTACDDTTQHRRCFDAGADAVILKPFSSDGLKMTFLQYHHKIKEAEDHPCP